MPRLTWDQVGDRGYETGIDRGVLYSSVGGVRQAIPWNGLTGVDEGAPDSPEQLYYDGVKYFDVPQGYDYSATLRAFTYPDEFLEFEGVGDFGGGMHVGDQLPNLFSLSYRTRIGNDVDENLGYKIHILYNLTAIPSIKSFATLSGSNSPMEFSWDLGSVPEDIPGYKPTAHVVIDSTKMNRFLLRDLEDILYGAEDDTSVGTLPDLADFVALVDSWELITITDHGDGTFTVSGPDELVYATGDGTSFQVDEVDVVYGTSSPYSADTYTASTTYP